MVEGVCGGVCPQAPSIQPRTGGTHRSQAAFPACCSRAAQPGGSPPLLPSTRPARCFPCCSVPPSDKGRLKKSTYGAIYDRPAAYEGLTCSRPRSPNRWPHPANGAETTDRGVRHIFGSGRRKLSAQAVTEATLTNVQFWGPQTTESTETHSLGPRGQFRTIVLPWFRDPESPGAQVSAATETVWGDGAVLAPRRMCLGDQGDHNQWDSQPATHGRGKHS